MKIYTKTGDEGLTGLFGGDRVSKASSRVEAYGLVDELNSVLGIVRSKGVVAQHDGWLERIQAALFHLGAELSTVPGHIEKLAIPLLDPADVIDMEAWIDVMEEQLPPLKTFILPGGSEAASFIHLARTTCRRAERDVVRLRQSEPVREIIVHYLNRLSDFLFVLARATNHAANIPDVPWHPRHTS